MSNYTKSTNFATKDNLTPGDPLKIVRGTEIDTEFNNIATAIATKTDNASAAITGGTINDTTIGATTASTGAFTTLAASGNVTLSGGTANGVPYLNGSKVVTSGSALTFSGSELGVNATSTDASVSVKALTNAYASVLSLVANDNNGAQYNNISSSTSGGTVHWRIGGVAGISQMPFSIAGSEQMRLTSTGLGIGTSSPTMRLSVQNTRSDTAGTGFLAYTDSSTAGIRGLRTNTSNAWCFDYYNGSAWCEQMQIDSSGNLLVGTTSASSTTGLGWKVNNTDTNNVFTAQVFTSTTSAYTTHHLYSTGAGAYRFYVNGAGTVFATSTTISAISDRRFKENVRDLDAGLAEVMALKPRLYDWKEGKGANIKNARGFIAQEFEEVFPDLIDEWKDAAPEGEEPYKSVRQDLIPVLIKAIQEQQAIIESLKARLDAANL